MGVDYATNYTQDDVIVANQTLDMTNPKNVTYLNGTHYALDNDSGIAKLHKVVVEKPKYPIVTITAKPSCGCRHSYTWHKRSFVNYCPHCHHYNCLVNKHKWQSRYEQELTCKICDSDFCGVCGKTKYSWSRTYLRRAY